MFRTDLSYLARKAAAAQANRARCERDGCNMNGMPLWTKEELATLRQHYPDTKVLRQLLPRRSRDAICHMFIKQGLSKPRKPWTAAELSRLRRLFPRATIPELREAFPNRGKAAIYSMAQRHGIFRVRPYKPTGIALLDQVRAKCFETKIRLSELARDLGCSAVHLQSRARQSPAGVHALQRAVRYFGGRVEAMWLEG